MRRSLLRVLLGGLALVASGACRDPEVAPPPVEDPAPEPTPREKKLSWAPDPEAEVSLELVALQDDALTLDVVSRRAGAHGFAFRLEYDSDVLRLRELGRGAAWGQTPTLVNATEARQGLTVAVITARGAFDGLPEGEQVVGRLAFEVLRPAATGVKVVTGHTLLTDRAGQPLAATWSGGALLFE